MFANNRVMDNLFFISVPYLKKKSMESRLEAYRAQKKKGLEEQQTRARYWDLFTFATLRRRVFGENQTLTAHCQVNIPV